MESKGVVLSALSFALLLLFVFVMFFLSLSLPNTVLGRAFVFLIHKLVPLAIVVLAVAGIFLGRKAKYAVWAISIGTLSLLSVIFLLLMPFIWPVPLL